MKRIHVTAVVDRNAKLADDVEVGPFAVIGDQVELAAGVVIGPHVTVMGRTAIGARTRVFPSAVLGGDPQVLGFAGEPTALVIGEDNLIREFAAIHAGTPEAGGCTRIGDDNLIMNHVHVAHDCQVGSHCILAAYAGMGGHVVIQDHVVLGGMTGVHQFVRVGESVFTAGNAMLVKDAPPFACVAGDRAKLVGCNAIGLERRGFSPATIATVKRALRILFHSKLRFEPAVERVRNECPDSPEVGRLLGFLQESCRGFIR